MVETKNNLLTLGPVAVALVLNSYKVVINKGKNDGVKEGASFLFTAKGPEIFDPITNRSLGNLELVRGTGKVTHCQETMAVVTSTRFRTVQGNITTFGLAVAALNQPTRVEDLPFDGIEVGDVGRPV